MQELRQGMYARSLAGHDKGHLYVILSVDGEYVYLADGKTRRADRPKKKKIRHIQPDFHVDTEIREKLDLAVPIRDEDLKRAIKLKEEPSRR